MRERPVIYSGMMSYEKAVRGLRPLVKPPVALHGREGRVGEDTPGKAANTGKFVVDTVSVSYAAKVDKPTMSHSSLHFWV